MPAGVSYSRLFISVTRGVIGMFVVSKVDMMWSHIVKLMQTSVHRMLRVLLLLLLLLLCHVFTSSQSQICVAVRFGFVHCLICICESMYVCMYVFWCYFDVILVLFYSYFGVIFVLFCVKILGGLTF